jgi:hypothetical protein
MKTYTVKSLREKEVEAHICMYSDGKRLCGEDAIWRHREFKSTTLCHHHWIGVRPAAARLDYDPLVGETA